MALRKLLSKRLSILASSPVVPPNAAKSSFLKEYMTSPESSEKGFFRRFLHRRSINQLPEFLSMPVGEKLREKLKNITGDHRIRLDGLAGPRKVPETGLAGDPNLISVENVRKLLRLSQMEKLKLKLKKILESSIQYHELVQICMEECGNEYEGVELAKALDQSGNVIILGSIVFLCPEQVAKSIENIISQSTVSLNDPRREQLKEMEQIKALIDQKAQAQVRAELYCGLGFLSVQTLGFMRLTFWELSWDVMEPICFFVTSFHFALAYVFFMRTSVEPSFEGYFQFRFKTKQKKLMRIHNFDVDKYIELRKIFYPNVEYNFPNSNFHKFINEA